MHDVYAFGVIAPSTLLVLEDDYPPSGGYAEIAGVHPSFGGEAAGGAYVLARLGVATKLDGNWLGDDESSAHVIEVLSAAGVDCSAIRREGNARAVREVVLSTAGARTVLGTYKKLMADGAWNAPSEEDIRSSRIVCLDPFFDGESLQAARWCVDADTPYVTVDARPDSEIARQAEVLVVSEEFATREFGPHDPHELLATYTDQCRGLVILTRGSEPLAVWTKGGAPTEVRALFRRRARHDRSRRQLPGGDHLRHVERLRRRTTHQHGERRGGARVRTVPRRLEQSDRGRNCRSSSPSRLRLCATRRGFRQTGHVATSAEAG